MYNRTQPLKYLVYAAIFGAVCGYGLQITATTVGASIYSPHPALGTVFLAIGGVVLGMANQVRKELLTHRVLEKPLLAVRVLAAARAAALLGAGALGFSFGLGLWILPRLAHTASALILPIVALGCSALLLAIAGIVAENWCKVPPADTTEAE